MFKVGDRVRVMLNENEFSRSTYADYNGRTGTVVSHDTAADYWENNHSYRPMLDGDKTVWIRWDNTIAKLCTVDIQRVDLPYVFLLPSQELANAL